MAIPPSTREAGQPGHVADHNAISTVLTTHAGNLAANQASLTSLNSRVSSLEGNEVPPEEPPPPPPPPDLPPISGNIKVASTTTTNNSGPEVAKTLTVDAPTGIAAGDVILLAASYTTQQGGGATWSPPSGSSGWEELAIDNVSAGNLHMALWGKAITGTPEEPANYTFSFLHSGPTNDETQICGTAFLVKGVNMTASDLAATVVTIFKEESTSRGDGVHAVPAIDGVAGELGVVYMTTNRNSTYADPGAPMVEQAGFSTSGGYSSTFQNHHAVYTFPIESTNSFDPPDLTYGIINTRSVCFVIRLKGNVNIGPVGGTTGLRWPRPDYSSYAVLNVPSTGRLTNLSTTTDYLLVMPAQPVPELRITGGRNVVIIGGEVRIDTPPQYLGPGDSLMKGRFGNTGSKSLSGGDHLAVDFKNFEGHFYVEGLKIGGNWCYESINANAGNRPNAKLTMQRIRIGEPTQPILGWKKDGGNHDGGDVFQTYAGMTQGLYFSQWTVWTTYQGYYIQDWSGTAAEDFPVYFDRIDIRHPEPSVMLNAGGAVHDRIVDQGWPAPLLTEPVNNHYVQGTFRYWLAGNQPTVTDVYFRDCWIGWWNHTYTRNFNDQIRTADPSVGGAGSPIGGVNGTMYWEGENDTPKSTLRHDNGLGPAGDGASYCPPSLCGIGYTGA